jgi:lysophospholipase L1-like esterase
MHSHLPKLLLAFLIGMASVPVIGQTQPDTVLIDFGNTASAGAWNNVSDPVAGTIADMVNTQGLTTGVGIAINDPFNNINTNGTTTPAPGVGMPGSATGDSFFGNTATFGGQIQATGGVVFSGLSRTTRYRFEIFASRMSVGDNREAAYIISGRTVDTLYLDAANNAANLAVLQGMYPDTAGNITLLAQPGPNNTNGSGFYYLGAIRMVYTLSNEDSVLIDFGNNLSAAPWNNVTDPVAGTITDLVNANGFTTGVGIAVTDPFNNINTAGTLTPDTTLQFPGTATGDSFFGNTTPFGGQTQPTGAVTFSGLDTAKTYSFTVFASRMSVADNREAQYTFIGCDTTLAFLDASNNTANVASAADLLPDSNGTITLISQPGPNNTNGSGFYYLGAIRMTYPVPAVTPPPAETLTLVAPVGGEVWESGKGVLIRWQSTNVQNLIVELSRDNGQNWATVDTVPAISGKFGWNVPQDTSSQCLIRLSSSQLTVQSDSVFSIVDDNGRDCKIVVLGSSTAAGTGPSSSDSAWVKRYWDYLYQRNTDFLVSNLAQGGFTTYNILPTGTPIPAGVNQTVNTQKNITKAIELLADAIIINMPSNDATNSYPVADQLANYDLILAAADADTVPVWITTTQPRNLDAARIQLLTDMRDSTLARYDSFAIDFWTTLALPDGRIDPAYDSGDGIHLNNAAHKILFERVLGAGIHTWLLNSKNAPLVSIDKPSALQMVQIYPNPFQQQTRIDLALTAAADIQLVVLDMQGRMVTRLADERLLAGVHSFDWNRDGLPAGLYLFQVRSLSGGHAQTETFRVVIRD